MTTQTCNPLNARLWFKFREPINWIIVLVIFVPFVFVVQTVCPIWIADTIAIALVFSLYSFLLYRRAIGISCPHCHEHINTNTPWVCGFDRFRNGRIEEFPFINQCERCGAEPKAYMCHHCGKLIFLSKDRQGTNFAASLGNYPIEPEKDDYEEAFDLKSKELKLKELSKKDAELDVGIKELAVKDTGFDVQLKSLRQNLEPPKMKTLEEKYRSMMKNADDAQRLKASIKEEFKDDPAECERRLAAVDDAMRDMPW